MDSAELAYHFRGAAAGGGAAKALSYAEEAARRAMAMLAYEAAVSHYEHALGSLALSGGDPHRRTELLLDLGDARVAAGDLGAARSAFEEAAVLARMQREPEQLARAALGFGSGPAGFEVAQFDRAQVALLREALDALQGETPLRAWLLARLSVAAGLGALDGDRRAHAEQAIGLVRDAGQPAALAYALSAHCDVIAGPAHTEERLTEASEILALARECRDARMELLGRRMRIAALLELGAIGEVDAEVDAYARTAEAMRQPLYTWYVPLWRGMRALMQGRIDRARQLCAEAERIGVGSHSENALMLTTTLRMWIDVHAGTAEAALARWHELMRQWPDYLAMTRPPIAITQWYAGRVEEARATLDHVRIEELTEESLGAEWLLASRCSVRSRAGSEATSWPRSSTSSCCRSGTGSRSTGSVVTSFLSSNIRSRSWRKRSVAASRTLTSRPRSRRTAARERRSCSRRLSPMPARRSLRPRRSARAAVSSDEKATFGSWATEAIRSGCGTRRGCRTSPVSWRSPAARSLRSTS